MPQTNEVVEFAKSMGFIPEPEDNPVNENSTDVDRENVAREIADASQAINTSDSTDMFVIPEKDSNPSSSSTSSSISSSGLSSSIYSSHHYFSIDIDEFYDDPSDILSQEIASNTDFQVHISLFQFIFEDSIFIS